jgi:hypothetical protein
MARGGPELRHGGRTGALLAGPVVHRRAAGPAEATAAPAGRCGARAGATGTEDDRMAEVGRLLHPDDREALLAAFPPAYPRVVAPLVALEGAGPPAFPLPTEAEGFVVGVADDGAGVQALVVEIGGTTRRPDGSAFHITWSLGARRRAVESNDVIRERGWTATRERYRVRLDCNTNRPGH